MTVPAELWDLWFPGAGARGMSFARGRLDATATLLVHAPPDQLDVDVWSDAGELVARARGLGRTASSPIARLTRRDQEIVRDDIWPTGEDIGRPVILPGGEVGHLRAWWNDADQQEWRWTVEFYNHI